MFKINPIKLYNIYKSHLTEHASVPFAILKTPLDIVSIKNKEPDLLTLKPKELFTRVTNSIKPENFIGDGMEANVYNIPQTPYCVRLIRNFKGEEILPKIDTPISLNIKETDSINHVVAKIGKRCAIMTRLGGVACSEYPNKKEFLTLPTESYHQLIKQIAHARNHNMIFDSHDANVIYNCKNKSLTAIDFYPQSKCFAEDIRPLSAIFHTLVDNFKPHPNQARKLAGTIFKGYLKELAVGVKPEIEIQGYGSSWLLEESKPFILSKNIALFNEFSKDFITAEYLKLKELTGNDYSALPSKLEDLEKKIDLLYMK